MWLSFKALFSRVFAISPVLIFHLMVLSACASKTGLPLTPVYTEDGQPRQILVTFSLRHSSSVKRAGSTSKHYGSAYQQRILNDQFADMLARKYGLRIVEGWSILSLGVHCIVYEVPDSRDIAKLVALVQRDPQVDAVQTMQQFKTRSQSYNDPYLTLQHSIQAIQLRPVHSVSLGRGIKLAIIDTGIDIEHPEFKGRIVSAHDFASAYDVTGGVIHGTAVAGVIAASANNGIGIIGVAPEVKIVSLKACWQVKQLSSEALCNSFTLAQAVDTAIKQGVQIMNLSLSGPDDPLLRRLLDAALAKGLIVITADDGSGAFPASMSAVIAVASADPDAVQRYNRFYAPGLDILTTMPGGEYDFMSGSSFAAAHISGLAALLLERKRNLNTNDMIAILKSSSSPYMQTKKNSGGAAVNVCSALTAVVAVECGYDPVH